MAIQKHGLLAHDIRRGLSEYGQFGHMGNGSQSFASKSVSGNGAQVLKLFQFRGRESLTQNGQILVSNATSIVADLQEEQKPKIVTYQRIRAA